jgi:hypothetical protein
MPNMSAAENVEVARRSFAGWNEGGVQGSRDVGWTDDAEFHDPPSLPGAADATPRRRLDR